MHRAIYTAAAATMVVLLLNNPFCALKGSSFDGSTAMLRTSTQAVLAAASMASAAVNQQVLDLSTVDWTLTSPNFSYISVPGKVPSQVHLDLREAQVSEHSFEKVGLG